MKNVIDAIITLIKRNCFTLTTSNIRNYPSSQTCCTCGYKNSLTKNLSVRRWICPVCGTVHDRDQNAAINILRKALEMKNSA